MFTCACVRDGRWRICSPQTPTHVHMHQRARAAGPECSVMLMEGVLNVQSKLFSACSFCFLFLWSRQGSCRVSLKWMMYRMRTLVRTIKAMAMARVSRSRGYRTNPRPTGPPLAKLGRCPPDRGLVGQSLHLVRTTPVPVDVWVCTCAVGRCVGGCVVQRCWTHV